MFLVGGIVAAATSVYGVWRWHSKGAAMKRGYSFCSPSLTDSGIGKLSIKFFFCLT